MAELDIDLIAAAAAGWSGSDSLAESLATCAELWNRAESVNADEPQRRALEFLEGQVSVIEPLVTERHGMDRDQVRRQVVFAIVAHVTMEGARHKLADAEGTLGRMLSREDPI